MKRDERTDRDPRVSHFIPDTWQVIKAWESNSVSFTNRPRPMVIIKLKLHLTTGCEAKNVAKLSSHPLSILYFKVHMHKIIICASQEVYMV